MELRDYFRALRRHRLVFIACVVVGMLGAVGYNRATYLDEAKASVAVLSPIVSSKASGTTEAQVTFDAIIKSDTLASLVGARMNEPTKTVSDDLSVSVDAGTGASAGGGVNPSPLYVVHGLDKGLPRAEMLVNIAVEEASQLYVKLNATDGSDMKAALATQGQEAAGEVTSAQNSLDLFTINNDAVDLQNRIEQQRGKVIQLSLAVDAQQATMQADLQSNYPQRAQYSRDRSLYLTASSSLKTEQKELSRLYGLLGKYNQLQFELTAAQNRQQAFDAQSQNLLVNTLLPAQVQIKVLDPAHLEDQILFLLLVYGLGAVSGIILGLAAIYVLALIYKRPATVDEVAKALGAPILVRIPKAV